MLGSLAEEPFGWDSMWICVSVSVGVSVGVSEVLSHELDTIVTNTVVVMRSTREKEQKIHK